MKTAKNISDAKADGNVLRAFFNEVAPNHDEEKVYASDMKKVISWYQILKDMPLFTEEPKAAEGEDGEKPITKAIEKPKHVEKKATAAPKGPKVSAPRNPSRAG
ncbi:MAG: hypothetical protein ABIP28_11365, partial [Mucilaginibacter sp.]